MQQSLISVLHKTTQANIKISLNVNIRHFDRKKKSNLKSYFIKTHQDFSFFQILYNNKKIIFSHIKENTDYTITSVGVFGANFGGHVAVLASQSEKFNCVVAISPVVDWTTHSLF